MKKRFQIEIPESVLNDLRSRLASTRWTDEMENFNWEYGTNKPYLKELCNYWHDKFDWAKQEELLNSFQHFKSIVDGVELHYIHQKGEGEHLIPLLLIHGYPDSFVRFLKIMHLLTQADENGFSFDLIIPSIPGYGFSGIPATPGMNAGQIADLFSVLMTKELGYTKYIAHGGDWGSSITEQLALHHPGSLSGIHLTEIPFIHLFTIPHDELTPAEKKYLETGKQWQQTEGGYAMIQSTKPQTLAYGLNDSPAGLAAWIIEKFRSWSDCNGDLESCFTKDELLTNLTIYWATQTINSAFRLYYESAIAMAKQTKAEWKKIEVPTAIAMFPKDIINAPKDFAYRFFNVQQWTEMPKGGHFAAWEQPKLLADDIRKFAAEILKYS
jgi:pimeloyl-ACP methyl ester carboxylesterase